MSLLQSRSLPFTIVRQSQRPAPVKTRSAAVALRPCRQQQYAARMVTRSSADGDSAAVSSPNGSPEGQMSVALMQAMQAKITEALEAERVVVSDVFGDGRHVNIDVVSAAFEGKNSVQRQRMVYKAIWLELQDAVHAVDSMSTKTPAEASA